MSYDLAALHQLIDQLVETVVEKTATRVVTKLAGAQRTTEQSDGPAYLTVKEAAVRLRVHERTVQRLLRQGDLARLSVAGAVRLRAADVDAYVSRTAKGVSPANNIERSVIALLSKKKG